MNTQETTLERARARDGKSASTDEPMLVGQANSKRSGTFGELYERHRFGRTTGKLFFMAVLLLLCSATRIFAQTAMAPSDGGSGSHSQPRQYLFGDWGGKRSELATPGVTFSFFYVADLQANPVGGLEQTQRDGEESAERWTSTLESSGSGMV